MLFRRIPNGSVTLRLVLRMRKLRINCGVFRKLKEIWSVPHQWTAYYAETLGLGRQRLRCELRLNV